MSIGRQIRAARGLLRWSGAVLAEKAGLTRDTINKIEDEAVQPREGTLKEIIRVFNDHGVEFTDNSGVRFRPQGVEILAGPEGLRKFFDDVYEHICKRGGKIMQYGIEERLGGVMGAEYLSLHRKRMKDAVAFRKDALILSLFCEGDKSFIASDYAECRWIAKEQYSPMPLFVYGECAAIMSIQTIASPTIIVHKFPAIVEGFRKQFEIFWNMAKRPS